MNAYAAVYRTSGPVRGSHMAACALLAIVWSVFHIWALSAVRAQPFTVSEYLNMCICFDYLEPPEPAIYPIRFAPKGHRAHLAPPPRPRSPHEQVYLPINHFRHYPTDTDARHILGRAPNRLDATIEVTCEPAPRGRLKNCVSDDENATLARATETLFERHAVTRKLSIAERSYHLRVRYSWTGTTQ